MIIVNEFLQKGKKRNDIEVHTFTDSDPYSFSLEDTLNALDGQYVSFYGRLDVDSSAIYFVGASKKPFTKEELLIAVSETVSDLRDGGPLEGVDESTIEDFLTGFSV